MPKYAKQTPDGIVVVAEFAADPGGGYVAVAAAGVRPSPIHTLSLSNGVLQWVDARALADVKVTAWGAIKSERERRLFGTFAAGGKTYDCNREAINTAATAAMRAKNSLDLTWVKTWTLADNTSATLTADQMIAVALACDAYIGDLWATGRTLRAQIGAATTITQVEAITWP